MSGYIRQIQSSDGTPITAPTTVILGAASYVVFANDAAYEAVYGAGSEGDAYFNSTDQQVRVYKNAAWEYHNAGESVYDNTGSGLTATDVQAAIDEVEGRVDAVESGKQDDVITTRGDTIIGNASGDASRLAIGSAGFVLTSDGTDPAWAPAAGGGGVGGKNYILNPDASVNATTGVSNTATTGSWTIARTTTAAELAEETKGTGYKISGSTLTVGDTVEFAIEATGIDDADGGFIARGVIKVLDISGSINGEYEGQFYNVTDSVYVGDEVTITGTGTYVMSVPVIAGNDYEFHLKAATGSTTWTNIGLSGITLEPESPTYGSLGGWKQYDESTVTFSSTPAGWSLNRATFIPYKDPTSGTWRLTFNIDADITSTTGTRSATIDGVTFKTSFHQALSVTNFIANSAVIGWVAGGNGTVNINSELSFTKFSLSGDVELDSKPTWADWDNTALTASDVQYEGDRVRYYNSTGGALAANTAIDFDTESPLLKKKGNFSNSSGEITVPAIGTYRLSSRCAIAASGAFTVYLALGGTRKIDIDSGTSTSTSFGNTVEFTIADPATETISIRSDSANISTLTTGDQQAWLAITRISDYSARSASLPFNRWQKKTTTGAVTVTGVISELTFNNLVIGKMYKASIFPFMGKTGNDSNDSTIRIDIENNSVSHGYSIQILQQDAGTDRHTATVSGMGIFKAEATTCEFNVTTMTGATSYVAIGSYAIIEELNMHVDETTDFT